jgi:hypothetical protein
MVDRSRRIPGDQLTLDLGDHVQMARYYVDRDRHNSGTSFYVKPTYLTEGNRVLVKNLWFAERIFNYEVDWTFLFRVTDAEADDILREISEVHDGRG